ncbi:MAG: 30S ribosomal protein S27ae [Candidatus Bathyarchaeia archaeon]
MSSEEKETGKKKARSRSRIYEFDYQTGSAKLKNRKCSRCGKIMALHPNVNRWSCGGCGYTEYIRKQ